MSADRVNIPLLAQLIPAGIKPGTIITVEFDPDSQWLAVATTITAKYLQAGGRVGYTALARPPLEVMEALATLGIDVASAVKEGRLRADDWYTASLTGDGSIARRERHHCSSRSKVVCGRGR